MTDLSGLETTPEVGDEKLGPAGAATLIADFVDVLIPGERLWPSASTVGVQGHLALRLMEERGKNALPTLVKAIEAAGGPLAGLDEAARVAIVQRFEEAEPDLFGWVRDAAYIAYYENPFVAEAIVLTGHPYELRPAHQRLCCAAFRSGARHAATWEGALHEDVGGAPRRHQRPRSREQPNPSLGPEAMTKSQDCDVLIVGAGATGALAATITRAGRARCALSRTRRMGRAGRSSAL